MQDIITELQTLITLTVPRLQAITAAESVVQPTPTSWSKRQVLGHLIDSAANNHQRFVRAQLQAQLEFPDYEQEGWVNAQAYQTEDWSLLVSLWTSYNQHLLHVLTHMPAEQLQTPCIVEQPEPVTLEYIIRDYLRHLHMHLAQLFGEG